MWVRHSDFYTAQYRVDESLMGPSEEVPSAGAWSVSATQAQDPVQDPTPEPTEQELRSQQWGPVRSAPSRLVALVLKGYRRLISPLYGQVCSFYPSCSAYGLEAVTVHGVLRGVPMTLWRILRCNPFSGGGVDHVRCAPRIWPEAQVPSIIETNHPPMSPQASASQTSRDQRADPTSSASAEPRAGSP